MGTVGIGITASLDTTYKFDVNGKSRFSDRIDITGGSATSPTFGYAFYAYSGTSTQTGVATSNLSTIFSMIATNRVVA